MFINNKNIFNFKISNSDWNICFQVLKNVGKLSASLLAIIRPKNYKYEISYKTYNNKSNYYKLRNRHNI